MSENYFKNLLPTNDLFPSVIDLFSGCGGLAYGFRSAGFPIAEGMDLSSAAVETASYNLSWRFGEESHHRSGDITQCTGDTFNTVPKKNGVIVIGGPPCQAYSQAGRGKLRSLGKDREHTNDLRGQLYLDFLRIAFELDARAIVMENVPEAVNYGGLNVPEHVCELLEEYGYRAAWTILNAADYGVPQVRERMFIMAIKESEGLEPSFPIPTHQSVEGKMGAYRQRSPKLLSSSPHFHLPPEAPDSVAAWVTVNDALSDLPRLFPTSRSKYRLYGLNILLKYDCEAENDFQKLMRGWTGSSLNQVSGHGYRRTVRDFPIFERMKPEDNFLAASSIAETLLDQACGAEGITEINHPERYQLLRRKIVPPYSRGKFHDKWKRLNPDRPSHTLVAHLSVDTYSHIHPWEPRGISVREAARLQSFPDDFLFQCNMGDAFRQIGNAVPPLLSYALARHLLEIFDSGLKEN
ncbi:DNA cytosine methyltransferase [Paenibacillus vini]|uniref:DNA cytosine methyltransferase n=1 Tax=Paenibacillus vini TaxID=1476024 RepID=UPI0025B6DCDD|nr:DNA cytosine methyltransferase [Paenibacillus vini]MDN4066666.1 DNA cytosine methyltransferase [Paenibacillus vini]